MSLWTTFKNPFGANRAQILFGLSSSDGKTPVPVAVNETTGEVLVSGAGGGGGGSTTNANLYGGQVTVNTTAVQLSAVSHALTNGVIIKALSTNAANIVVGLVGVTGTTGDILEPGEARGYGVNNTNLLYIISPSSTTDKVTWSGN